jgi:hypothetical protein
MPRYTRRIPYHSSRFPYPCPPPPARVRLKRGSQSAGPKAEEKYLTEEKGGYREMENGETAQFSVVDIML